MAVAKLGQRFTRQLGAAAIGFTIGLSALTSAQAQGLFAPRLYVNGSAVTSYEVDQRALFMRVLNSSGDLEQMALDILTDERLQAQYAKALGVAVTEEEIKAGAEEFAGRAQLTADQLTGQLQGVGVDPETFRDFIKAGTLWRKVVAAKFQGTIQVTSNDAVRALEALSRPRELKVRLSELVIPFEPGQEQEALEFANNLLPQISNASEFATAARQYSAAPSAQAGGVVDEWLALSTLPGPISEQVLGLGQGKASLPVMLPNAVLIFMLRDIAPDERAAPISVSVEYGEYWLPNSEEALADLRASADNCTDLHTISAKQGGSAVAIKKLPIGQIPSDVALELARLDPNEISTAHVGANGRRALMLCGRSPILQDEINLDAVKDQVGNQKLEGMVANLMEELRHAAHIRQP